MTIANSNQQFPVLTNAHRPRPLGSTPTCRLHNNPPLQTNHIKQKNKKYTLHHHQRFLFSSFLLSHNSRGVLLYSRWALSYPFVQSHQISIGFGENELSRSGGGAAGEFVEEKFGEWKARLNAGRCFWNLPDQYRRLHVSKTR